ncbi:hypothetical protein MgSA37_01722 [Mucilaginibacter gotjawali]|uniref:Uncharacterized protein n=2 Tax=Mucilaginibacter gotjawali TaxID=1550579 RepID=A0A839SGU4_9SPHI|nr:hypothetical protein [Mucilaginibacter gotjawali]BAU53553.1 hypothetical protein MgSA37_01722 [Mucilaginibacter gotjawali]
MVSGEWSVVSGGLSQTKSLATHYSPLKSQRGLSQRTLRFWRSPTTQGPVPETLLGPKWKKQQRMQNAPMVRIWGIDGLGSGWGKDNAGVFFCFMGCLWGKRTNTLLGQQSIDDGHARYKRFCHGPLTMSPPGFPPCLNTLFFNSRLKVTFTEEDLSYGVTAAHYI